MISRIAKAVRNIGLVAILLLCNTGHTFATDKTDFNVDVEEVLSVSITTPTTWAVGDVDTFLRNKVSISVVTNNSAGFTASMTMKTNETALINSAKNSITLPTLTANTTRANFPANYWGYSLNDTEVGNNASTYSALVGSTGTPITILSSTTASSGSKDFYFGAKANATLGSGTYTGTVVISVVTGVINNTNPVTPVNPVNPTPTPNTPTYDPTTDVTSYTYNTSAGSGTSQTTTTTTDINSGDTRDVYSGYVPPQGVTKTTFSNMANYSGLEIGLGLAAAVATSSSIFFLFAASRDDDDENML